MTSSREIKTGTLHAEEILLQGAPIIPTVGVKPHKVINHADISNGETLTGLTDSANYSIYVKSTSGLAALNSTTPVQTANLVAGDRVTILCTSATAPVQIPEGALVGTSATLGQGESLTMEWNGTNFYKISSSN